MQQNNQTTLYATSTSNPVGTGSAQWSNPNGILAAGGTAAQLGALAGSGSATLNALNFPFALPPSAIVDGIQVNVDNSLMSGQWADVTLSLSLPGTTGKNAMALNGPHGGPTDKWGASSIALADLVNMDVTLFALGTVDDVIVVDFITVTVFWHIELNGAPKDVPTRTEYKVYTKDNQYIGTLPKVTSDFVFPQDIGSAGSSIEVTCGVKAYNDLTTSNLTTGDGIDITNGLGAPLTVTTGTTILARGEDDDLAVFKNGNRVKVWIYNYWYPNGKLMFSGQINKIKPKFAGGKSNTKVTIYSDGLDLNNLVARGYPFSYTNDVSQTTQSAYATAWWNVGNQWNLYGQSFVAGGSVNNIGAIALMLRGSAQVTVLLYDGPNGNLLGSATQFVNVGVPTVTQFEFSSLIDINPNGAYFFAVWVNQGQSIDIYYSPTSVYTDGFKFNSQYAGGSGGGDFTAESGDLYFVTKSGTPTTTATYSNQDPVVGMMRSILTDYNNRGGYIKEGTFVSTNQSLSYTFNMAFIFDAMKKVLEMSPSGYVSYIDLGTSKMDIFPMSETADFVIVNGTDAIDVDLELSIEQVKNYLLLTGGEVTPGVNLYRDYKDSSSEAAYGTRTMPKSDNRMTVTATADAIGNSFIAENADEAENLTVIIPITAMDTTLLKPGKTIGFKNYGNLMDAIVQAIIRREWHNNFVILTLGKMPVRMNDEIQRINRELLNEQTINNPTAPS